MQNNILYTIRNTLCTGCGICEDVCPTHSIEIRKKGGEWKPILNEITCLGDKCGRCLKVCPGVGCDLKKLSNELFQTTYINHDKYIGNYFSLYTGYSLNSDIRFHSASGGVVSQFLIYLLEKRLIDGAVVTAFSENDHITPISYIAKTKEDIIKARSSKYCPVSLNRVGNEIVNSEGKYVIVGLPCHIQGFRKRAKIDRKFRERIIGYFSIYCSSNRNFYAQDYLLKKYKITKKDISYFAYRDNGCLGNMVIETRRERKEFPSSATFPTNGCRESKSTISIPYTRYYGALRSFFKPRRCLTCIDHYGELADVCFGDIHIKPYSEDKVGISSWIVRNTYFDQLFKQAETDGYIKMDVLDAHTLNESQKTMLYPKQKRAHATINIDKIFGKKTVMYDIHLENPQTKDYITEIICHFQRYIGKHKSLWWIIDLLYNQKLHNKTNKK